MLNAAYSLSIVHELKLYIFTGHIIINFYKQENKVQRYEIQLHKFQIQPCLSMLAHPTKVENQSDLPLSPALDFLEVMPYDSCVVIASRVGL